MNLKYLLFIISILLIFLSVVILFSDEKSLVIQNTSKIYSVSKTSETEYIHLLCSSNKEESYYYSIDKIVHANISNNLEEIPIIIKDIKISESNDEETFIIDLSFKIGFDSDDYSIMFEHAVMNLTYRNNEELQIVLGEFNYLFYEDERLDLSFTNLSASYDVINDIETVSGLFFELHNSSDTNIVITDIDVLSSSVDFNNGEAIKIYDLIETNQTVEDILKKDYDFFELDSSPLSMQIRSNQTETMYIPLSFTSIPFIHRFSMVITYTQNNEEYTYIIDDFPFMNTNLFNEEYSEWIHTYEID